jgi:putative transposase
MRNRVLAMLSAARSSLKSRRELALENLALRQQLAVLRRQAQRPKLSRADRAFWVVLARVWPEWRTALAIVQPAPMQQMRGYGFSGS